MSFAGDNSTDQLEGALRRRASQFPGTTPGADDGLADVVARGRRRRTVVRGVRGAAAGLLLATGAVAAPGLFDPGPVQPEVTSHGDEEAADAAPWIEVTSPEDGAIVSHPVVAFSGRTEPGVDVRVGGADVPVAGDGTWRIELHLEAGEQTLTFWAVDSLGNRGFDTVSVTYRIPVAIGDEEEAPEEAEESVEDDVDEAPQPEAKPTAQPVSEPKEEPKPTEAKPAESTVAFTANQRYGSCSEPVPYDEFWGTATPGHEIWVWSEYGEKKLTVGESGHWEARVEFPTAPSGKAIDVKVKDLTTGERVHFTFTNTGGGGHDDVAWHADMKDNHVEYDPPYARFAGTAPAGTVVEIASPYGGNRTEAGSDGTWFVKVWFEGAPYGTHTWAVVVESSNGDRDEFEYTGTRPEPSTEWSAVQEDDHVTNDPPYSRYSGTGEPGATVWVGGEYGSANTTVGDDGRWAVKVWWENAPYGTHTWTVVVESSSHGGQRETFQFTGTRPEPATVDFTADQIHDVTDDDPPHSLYAGTAQPGTGVLVWSQDYGAADVRADDNGNWSLWVTFPDAPRGQTITVHVKSIATGQVKDFQLQVI